MAAVLPPFPVDDSTLDLLDRALTIDPTAGETRTSLGDLLVMLSELGGSDTSKTTVLEPGDPFDPGLGGAEIVLCEDPCYHEQDVIAALIAEVRTLRSLVLEVGGTR